MRKATPDDIACFMDCLQADADHKGQNPDDWTLPPGEFMVFYDKEGNRLWVRIEKVLRISLQHDQKSSPRTVAVIMHHAFHWLIGSARQSKYSEIIFESRASRLIQFLQRLFGIKPVESNWYVRPQ